MKVSLIYHKCQIQNGFVLCHYQLQISVSVEEVFKKLVT